MGLGINKFRALPAFRERIIVATFSLFLTSIQAYGEDGHHHRSDVFRQRMEKLREERRIRGKAPERATGLFLEKRRSRMGKDTKIRRLRGSTQQLSSNISPGAAAVELRVAPGKLRHIFNRRSEDLSLPIAIPDLAEQIKEVSIEAALVTPSSPIQVFDEKGKPLLVESSLNYRGSLADSNGNIIPNSVATLSISKDSNVYKLMGTITVLGKVFDFGSTNSTTPFNTQQSLIAGSAPSEPVESVSVVETSQLTPDTPGCSGDIEPPGGAAANISGLLPDSSSSTQNVSGSLETSALVNSGNKRPVKIGFWLDYQFYTDHGSNVQNAVNYFTGIFNQVAAQYEMDGIAIELGKLTVFTSADRYKSLQPIPNTSPSFQVLSAFATDYYLTLTDDLGHLISSRPVSHGGVAYVGGLCGLPGARFAYSNIYNSYSNVPTYSWTVNVIAHELGHNLGSPHTHRCVWNGNNTAIDGCYTPEPINSATGLPFCAKPAVPAGFKGTIMSYCHLSNGIDPLLGFGPQPLAQIKSTIAAASCLSTVSSTADTTGPSLSFIAPKFGSTISNGTNNFQATAMDPSGVSKVDFYIDAQLVGSATSRPYNLNVAIPTSLAGNHTFKAVAFDTKGNSTTVSIPVTVVVDTTLPVIKQYSFNDPSTIEANKTFKGTVWIFFEATDNVGVSSVEIKDSLGRLIGPQPTVPTAANSPSYYVQWNTTTVANGAQFIQIRAADAAGNEAVSTVSFTINNAGGTTADTVPPVVSFTAPALNATVSGTVTLTATASDTSGIKNVAFYNGTTQIGATDTTSPYSVTWNTSSLTPGVYTLSAKATDNSPQNNIGSTTRTITVAAPPDATKPVVSITSPSANAKVSGTSIVIQASATDLGGSGLKKVDFYYNGTNFIGSDTTSPYQATLDTSALADGSYTLTAKATDGATNSTTSAGVVVVFSKVPGSTLDTQAPSIQWLSHSDGDELLAWVPTTLSVSVYDDVAVSKVEYFVNGTKICASVPITGNCLLSTTSRNSDYLIQVKATDSSGNIGTEEIYLRSK